MHASAATCSYLAGWPWDLAAPDSEPHSDGAGQGSSPPDGDRGRPGDPLDSMSCEACIQANSPRISYDSSWTMDDTSAVPFGTADLTGSSLSFSFNGSAIAVFSIAVESHDDSPRPEASYTIDDCAPVLTREPLANASDSTSLIPLFAANGLSEEDEHSIVITIENVTSPYVFAGFNIAPEDAGPGGRPPPPPSGPWPPPSQSTSSSSTPSVSPENLPSTDAQNQGPDHTLVVALTSVLGGVLFLLLIGCAVFAIRSWRRRRRQREMMAEGSFLTRTDSIIRNLPSMTWYSASAAGSRELVSRMSGHMDHPPYTQEHDRPGSPGLYTHDTVSTNSGERFTRPHSLPT
ncbi:hypothetical protein BD626DRAFT_557418 [Schizophyllum amplum]|uniref:T cell CD4 receptor C-terminal region domain-containing protein n=1 Tax=Schizophyllum amplum TaxID=97359 RepID=A0A550CF03_9AGAR|nr:hypothetical protein BD626DRAFT_557418 [Auriculariopsis ampla]